MARRSRVEYPGAIYHVINRGNFRSFIFESAGARKSFLECLDQCCLAQGWVLHGWVLMGNHYHLCVETPGGNLVEGMKWLQGTFANRFRFTNFYDFYCDLFQRVQALNAAAISGQFRESTASRVEKTASQLYYYRSLEQQLEAKRTELNSEPHFNRKTALKLEIQEIKSAMEDLKSEL